MFKSGDKVMAVGASHGWGSVREGDIGIVKEIADGGIYVNFPRQNEWYASERDLQLVQPPTEFKYKRSEHVVVENGFRSVFKDGTRAIIMECKRDRKGPYYLVRGMHDRELITQYIREEDLSKGFTTNQQALKLLRRD